MLDSGIDEDHLDLNVEGGRNFSGGSPNKWDDGNGHGTHTAGTVGAKDNGIGVVGVAPGVRLWAVRVCKNGGICLTGDMIAGIDWMADQKLNGITDFAVANMSISTSDDEKDCTARLARFMRPSVVWSTQASSSPCRRGIATARRTRSPRCWPSRPSRTSTGSGWWRRLTCLQ